MRARGNFSRAPYAKGPYINRAIILAAGLSPSFSFSTSSLFLSFSFLIALSQPTIFFLILFYRPILLSLFLLLHLLVFFFFLFFLVHYQGWNVNIKKQELPICHLTWFWYIKLTFWIFNFSSFAHSFYRI